MHLVRPSNMPGPARVVDKLRVAIVGAGPTGIAVLGALLRHRANDLAEVMLIDPLPPGLGNVFGDKFANDPALLCNSPVGITWIDATNPDDFYEYLVERGWAVSRDDLVPRYLIGEYTRHRYRQYCERAAALGIVVRHIAGRATRVREQVSGHSLACGDQAIHASDVILCLGIDQPFVPELLEPHRGSSRYLASPYPASRLRALPSASRVLVVGMRSSAMDAVVVLTRAGHHVTLTSRSGRLSAVRHAFPRKRIAALEAFDEGQAFDAGGIERVLGRALREVSGEPVVNRQVVETGPTIDALRQNVALARKGRTRWSELIFHGVNALNGLSTTLPPTQREVLVSNVRRYLNRFVSSLPLPYAERLLAAVESGRAAVRSDYPTALEPAADGWRARWPDGHEESFDYIVSATGFVYPPYLVDPDGSLGLEVEDAKPKAKRAILTSGLRLDLGTGAPSRIWVVGAGTKSVYPVPNVVWVAAMQAETIALDIGSAPSAVGEQDHERTVSSC